MARASRSASAGLDLDAALQRLVTEARRAVRADAATAWLPTRAGDPPALRGHAGLRAVGAADRAPVIGGPLARDLDDADRAALPWLADERFAWMLAVPIGGDGALAVFGRRGRAPRAALPRLRALVGEAAAGLDDARRHTELRERAERSELLLEVAQALAGATDLDAAIETVAVLTARALGAERCVIDVEEGVESRAPAAPPDRAFSQPIVRHGKTLGMLTLLGRRTWPPWAAELAAAVAAQIALVVDGVRLYHEARAQASELAALHEVSTRLTSTLDLATVLDGIADAASRLIGAARCSVFELDPTDQRLYFRAGRRVPSGQQPSLALALGQGAVGAAALRLAPVFTSDVQARPLPGYDDPVAAADERTLRDIVGEAGYRAILAIPIVSKERALGALAVYWDEVHAYDEREMRLLTGLVQQAAVAMERARLHEASLRRTEELGALLRAARTIMAGLDSDVVLQHILSEASAIAGTPHVDLLLVDREQQTLRSASLGGSPPPEAEVPVAASYSGRVAQTGEPLFIADTQDDPERPLADRDQARGLRTYLGLPVKSRGAVLGVLVFNTVEPRRYTAEELTYLGSFADLAAVAIDSARLYDETQRALADLKAAQQRLVQGETLRALGELAGGAAHHLNNLLTIVVGRVQLVLRATQDERLARPLHAIEKAAKDGAEVVRRLQQFSRMRQIAQSRLVDVSAIARDVVELTRGRWQDAPRAQGVQIELETGFEEVPHVPGDPAALRELVTNLIFNAVDAMPKGGRLTVTTAADAGAVVLTVADTGVGMPERVRLRAHEPFFTTKGVKATGLGLSVAYGVARRHGGDLVIASQEGRGTTVTVRVPISRLEAEPATTWTTVPARRGALRILLVDDEQEVREALADMLSAEGHVVVPAASGPEALAVLEADPALDVVLTDLVMPGMTGREVAVATKARRPHVLVGLVTGWGDVADADSAASVDFVLEKPVMTPALRAALARVRGR